MLVEENKVLFEIVVEEQKSHIDANSLYKNENNEITSYKKRLLDYASKIFLENKNRIIEIHSRDNPKMYGNCLDENGNMDIYGHKKAYSTLIKHTLEGLEYLINIHNKMYFTYLEAKPNPTENKILPDWIYWANKDMPMISIRGEQIQQIALLGPQGRKIIEGWEEFEYGKKIIKENIKLYDIVREYYEEKSIYN